MDGRIPASRFKIKNDGKETVRIYLEPNASRLVMYPGEELELNTMGPEDAFTMCIGKDDLDKAAISLWPWSEKGGYVVRFKGEEYDEGSIVYQSEKD